MRKITFKDLVLGVSALFAFGVGAQTLLLHDPTISDEHIAFVYAGDIYITDHNGEVVRRLTTHPATETAPHFSPDGKWIAFTANYDNNNDVYVVSAEGGQAKRLTWHNSADMVNGWTPDGEHILFTSRREMKSGRSAQLFKISYKGGFPEKIMRAVVAEADMHEDGEKIAYRPYRAAHSGASGWHNHRGGSTPPVWILNLEGNEYEEIPRVNATDSNPIWVKDDLYLLSDRDKTRNLYVYKDNKLEQVTEYREWDIQSADANGNLIVYSMGGQLHLLDTRRNRTKTLEITINPDLPQLRAQVKDAMPAMTSAEISKTGKRVLISARGDLYTVPVKDGSTRNLSKTSGISERDGLWSAKSDRIAYINDGGGVQKLVISDQFGDNQQTLSFGDYPADFRLIEWTADDEHVVYSDSNMALWAISIEDGTRTKVMQNINMLGFTAAGSADGKYLAYVKGNTNYFRDLYLYSFEDKTHTLISDGMSDVNFPTFDRQGKYLYFAASTNRGPTSFGLDLSTQERPIRFGLYAVVLQEDGESPLLPKPGDEEAEEADATKKDDENGDEDKQANGSSDDENGDDKKDEKGVDLEGIQSRIVALPVPQRSYTGMAVANDNNLYFIERTQSGVSIETNGRPLQKSSLKRFNFKDRKVETSLDDVSNFSISADGKTFLLRSGRTIKTAPLPKKGATLKAKALKTNDVKTLVNPRDEWAHIFNEAWRNERDYFYDPNMHGLDWQSVYEKYLPMLEHVGRREDLNRLMVEMIGEMEVGHNRVFGGDVHTEKTVRVGLLGADIRLKDGRYVVEKIYTGENWNPFLKAPLAAPGIGIDEGDTILAVNGTPLSADMNFYSLFVDTVGKQTRLLVSEDGSMDNSQVVIVEPVQSDARLRNWYWIESNRKLVDELSDGKVGYVYLPNTTTAGYTYFNRMFFAQSDRKAMIIDERQNGGGQAANYITDVLNRTYLSGWKYRSGDMILDTPAGAVYGPKVMLIDQDAGSGGDFLPYSFKRMGLGKLIGKTTWGGLIGISANRNFIDGGRVTVPHFRFFTPEHEWRVENEGVAPDIDVELDPTKVNMGEDTQLQRAIQEVLAELESYQPIRHDKAPAFPTELGK